MIKTKDHNIPLKKRNCNCKAEPAVDENGLEIKTPVIKYFFRFILFIVAVIIGLPVIIPMIIYMLFKTIVLSKSVDFLSTLIKLGKLMKRVDDEDDTDELDDENYELTGVEDITSK